MDWSSPRISGGSSVTGGIVNRSLSSTLVDVIFAFSLIVQVVERINLDARDEETRHKSRSHSRPSRARLVPSVSPNLCPKPYLIYIV